MEKSETLNSEKTIILIEANVIQNGLKASVSASNPNMYDIRKVAFNGKDNGLVARFNANTNRVIFDGTTWRSYKPYSHLSTAEIENLCIEKLKIN